MLTIFLVVFIAYCLLFLYSLWIRDNSIVDVFWGLGFMMIALISFWQSEKGGSQILMTLLILLWGIRLTSHIGFRKLREGKEDPRYAKWREEWGSGWYFLMRSFLQVYLLQMVLMLVVATPIVVVNLSDFFGLSFSVGEFFSGKDSSYLRMTQGGFFLTIEFIISIAGLIFEAIADRQLSAFIKIKKPGQIFTSGLYRYSRHPNYFGESMFWLGISLISLPFSLLGIIGWVVITCLLLFVSGVPMQEARYAGRPEWEEYRSRTNVFIPWWPKER